MSQSRRNGLKPTQDFTDDEITRRMNEALRRALTSPPKPHSEMKIGKRKAKAGTSSGSKNPNEPGPRKDK